ncbi:MAG: hypothetical protein D3923_06075, partial [Candidatus Electrothrix sp. AR3]|nr:hypothetical protein [Candidatus Electrothrix sp. AR3]
MFGILKNAGCAMAPAEQQQWTGHVCGLCLALKNQYGQFSRLTTNYDAALLSALYDAQSPAQQSERVSYCPLRKSFKVKVIAFENSGVRYAASMSLMMASSKIKDHILDNETGLRYIRGLATNIADRWMRAARESAIGLGFDSQRIEQQVHRQTEVEAQTDRDFFFYAQPTELAVGAAFEHTALLTEQPKNRDALNTMGRMFGRIMYLLDSYEDYASDTARHTFNALATSFPKAEWRPQAVAIFHQAYAELKKNFQQLELSRPALLQALLLQKLQRKGYKALQICCLSQDGGAV